MKHLAFLLSATALFTAPVQAATTLASIAPASLNAEPSSGGTLILAAPPRDSAEEGSRRFEPIAEYLSQVLGRKVVYRYPATWGGYQADMKKGLYDIVFDGPHFNGWRIDNLGHEVLLKAKGDFIYTAIVRQDDKRFSKLSQLVGRKVCAHAPPNLGTLIMQREFDNPARQPYIVPTDGYEHIYKALLDGKCDVAMLPKKHVAKFDPEGRSTRIIFQNKPMPQQALSVGSKITPAERAKIVEALTSAQATEPLARFREAYTNGNGLVRADSREYAGLGSYLRSEWGW